MFSCQLTGSGTRLRINSISMPSELSNTRRGTCFSFSCVSLYTTSYDPSFLCTFVITAGTNSLLTLPTAHSPLPSLRRASITLFLLSASACFASSSRAYCTSACFTAASSLFRPVSWKKCSDSPYLYTRMVLFFAKKSNCAGLPVRYFTLLTSTPSSPYNTWITSPSLLRTE